MEMKAFASVFIFIICSYGAAGQDSCGEVSKDICKNSLILRGEVSKIKDTVAYIQKITTLIGDAKGIKKVTPAAGSSNPDGLVVGDTYIFAGWRSDDSTNIMKYESFYAYTSSIWDCIDDYCTA